mgnify:CR=1 FL=1
MKNLTETLNNIFQRSWKRLFYSCAGAFMLYLFLHGHRNWIWAYFETMMALDSPDPSIVTAAKEVALASITAITTAFNVASATLGGIVLFFVTGETKTVLSRLTLTSSATANSAMNTLAETKHNIEEKLTHVITEGDPGAPARPPFTPDPAHTEEPKQ